MDLSQKAIENLYVGKSKISFQYFSDTGYSSKYETLNPNTTFSAIGSKLDFEGQPIKALNSYLPSYVVNGFMRISKEGLFIDKGDNLKIYLDAVDRPGKMIGIFFEPVKLYITTVPKKAFSINPCLLKSCLEARYYEDQVRGYLFQIITNDQISLIQYSYQCNYSFKINFEKDGSPRLHRKV